MMLNQDEWLCEITNPENELSCRLSVSMTNDAGWVGKRDTLESHLLFLVEKGAIVAELEGKEYLLERGSVLWVQPGMTRLVRVQDGCKQAVTRRMRFSLTCNAQHLLYPESNPVRYEAWELIDFFRMLARSASSGNDNSQWKRGAIYSVAAIYFSLPIVSDDQFRTFTDEQRRRLDDIFSTAEWSSLTPGQLAGIFHLSHDYFSRVFRNTYGLSPKSYLLRLRIERAAGILAETDWPLKQVCQAIGEYDLSKFCKQFKQITGFTPTQYRRSGS